MNYKLGKAGHKANKTDLLCLDSTLGDKCLGIDNLDSIGLLNM